MLKIKWLGHAAFQIDFGETTVLFDPWITGNPKSPLQSQEDIQKADVVLVTHDHGDHGYDDAIEICKRTGATLVAVHELVVEANARGVENGVGGNLGGEVEVKGLKIRFARAYHSCNIGTPCGFVVSSPEGTVYHAGDTDYYSDMKVLRKLYEIDVALLPIGSTYTMCPRTAYMCVEKVKPKVVVPMHYGTFPPVEQDPAKFKEIVGDEAEVRILAPGDVTEV